MSKQVIAITGGSGYIGSTLAKHLSKNFDIKLLDITPTKQQLDDSISFQVCNVTNYKEVEKSLQNVDMVIHASIIQIPVINEQKWWWTLPFQRFQATAQ